MLEIFGAEGAGPAGILLLMGKPGVKKRFKWVLPALKISLLILHAILEAGPQILAPKAPGR